VDEVRQQQREEEKEMGMVGEEVGKEEGDLPDKHKIHQFGQGGATLAEAHMWGSGVGCTAQLFQ